MNDHPDHLLAEYVDERLDPEDRVEVERHLDGCSICREEVLQARVARGALASLPEVDPPPGLPLAVRRRARPLRTQARARRAAGLAAAAAVFVAGGLVVLGQTGRETPQTAGRQGAGEAAQTPSAPAAPKAADEAAGEAGALEAMDLRVPTFRETDRNYTQADLSDLAGDLRGTARTALDSGLAPTAEAFYRDFDLSTLSPEVEEAIRCVIRDVPPQQLVVPLTVEAASFEGDPAYIASFLQGPAPDRPYDRILIWAVDREACTLRSFATQRL
jgi:anti-sigma factor RsiW